MKQIVAIVLFLHACMHAYGHPYHVARVELRYNTETSMVEGACKVFVEDVELFLYQTYGVRIDVAKASDSTVAQFVLPHLKDGVYLGSNFSLEWVGHELASPHLWLYFQVPSKKSPFVGKELPKVSLFCDKNEEMSFLIYLYEDDRLVQSLQSFCGTP